MSRLDLSLFLSTVMSYSVQMMDQTDASALSARAQIARHHWKTLSTRCAHSFLKKDDMHDASCSIFKSPNHHSISVPVQATS